jgi:hypothetical protein
MTAHELFSLMPSPLATDVLEFAFAKEKQLYRAAIQAVAEARKVRPVFLERQPRLERHPLMVMVLSRAPLEPVSDNLLRTWLLKKHPALLKDFLDALKIPHEDGVVENLPESVDEGALRAAIEQLLAKHPPELVAVYLHAFNHMNESKWTGLETLLQNEPRLQLKRAA